MKEEDRSICCQEERDPAAFYERYFHQLILVGSHGDDWSRRLFVRAHRRFLGGYAGYLLHLSEEHLRMAFADALTAQQGRWPETLMGFRLAVPPDPPQRRRTAWSVWGGLADYAPEGLALDPVCGMFVDPHATPYTAHDGSETVYFCCPRCRDAYVPVSADPVDLRAFPDARPDSAPTSA